MNTDPQTDIVNVDFWAGRIAAFIKLAEHYGMTVEITGDELVVSRQVSDVFVAQTEVQWRAASPAAAPEAAPPTGQTAEERARISAKLWEIAEHHIIAEWICCEPLKPKHTLCAKGYAALGMARTLLVDADPAEAWNPEAPVLDAVLALLPADSEPHRLALSDVLGLGTSAPWDAIRERAAELAALPAPVDRAAVLAEAIAAIETERDATDVNVAVYPRYDGKERIALGSAISVLHRLAAEEQRCPHGCDISHCPCLACEAEQATGTPQPETQAAPRRGDAVEQWLKTQRDEYQVESSPQWGALNEVLDTYRLHADTGTPLGEHVCEGRVVGDCECLEMPAAAHSCGNCEGIDPDSCLTNLDRPAAKARQGATKTPDDASDGYCKCQACWGWFVEDHPGEDLDDLGKDLSWWSGLPEHRDAPAGVSQPAVTLPGKEA